MTRELFLADHPSTTPKPYDQAEGDAHQRVAPKPDSDPNSPGWFRRHLPPAVAAAGAAAVILVLGNAVESGAHSVAEGVDSLLHGADVYSELKQPYPAVAEGLKTGDIDASDATTITITHPTSAWAEAKTLAGDDHAAGPLSEIAIAQQGANLQPGDKIVEPTDSIDISH